MVDGQPVSYCISGGCFFPSHVQQLAHTFSVIGLFSKSRVRSSNPFLPAASLQIRSPADFGVLDLRDYQKRSVGSCQREEGAARRRQHPSECLQAALHIEVLKWDYRNDGNVTGVRNRWTFQHQVEEPGDKCMCI